MQAKDIINNTMTNFDLAKNALEQKTDEIMNDVESTPDDKEQLHKEVTGSLLAIIAARKTLITELQKYHLI